jgi:hypothetical protein
MMTAMGMNPAATPVYEPWLNDQLAGTYTAHQGASPELTSVVSCCGNIQAKGCEGCLPRPSLQLPWRGVQGGCLPGARTELAVNTL